MLAGESHSTTPKGCPRLHHSVVDPSRWCISSSQLKEFLAQVELLYPDRDPSAYEVVEEYIKPLTCKSGASYALMKNPKGLAVRYFISHSWAEGVKEFCRNLLNLGLQEGGLWICFLANPQTWPRDELSRLLGSTPWTSPFCVAIMRSSWVIFVQNQRMNIFERLWCVFELFAAHHQDKPVTTIGRTPQGKPNYNSLGLNGTASDPADTSVLRAAMEDHEEDVRIWIEELLSMTVKTLIWRRLLWHVSRHPAMCFVAALYKRTRSL
mmetsp:Transcript_1101/g.2533  ORF Transcript_1101/g.2533 Transcript_1101/m.2533 type:complete len:266 (+) Transcript_1101:35-832(+)